MRCDAFAQRFWCQQNVSKMPKCMYGLYTIALYMYTCVEIEIESRACTYLPKLCCAPQNTVLLISKSHHLDLHTDVVVVVVAFTP